MVSQPQYSMTIDGQGVLNIISGGDELGPMMTSHPGFAKISFTGSTATGKRIMESAARDLKRVTLELGGNDAAIVLPDVDTSRKRRRKCSDAREDCVACFKSINKGGEPCR